MQCLLLGCWTASCLGCLILVCNRLAELMDKGKIFEVTIRFFFIFNFSLQGRRTYAFLSVATVYGIVFALFTPPPIFNSKYQSFFFNPYIDDSQEVHFFLDGKIRKDKAKFSTFIVIFHMPSIISQWSFYRRSFMWPYVLLSSWNKFVIFDALTTQMMPAQGAMSTDVGRKRIRASRAVSSPLYRKNTIE